MYCALFQCFQADDPTKSDTAILQVNVIDINDNAARFDTTFLNVTLVENAFSGSYVAEVTATDADQVKLQKYISFELLNALP